jgi:hypothetical protein
MSQGRTFSPASDTIINVKDTYKRAQELFNNAYRYYLDGKNKARASATKSFTNLLKDPLCLLAAFLGRTEIDQQSSAIKPGANSRVDKDLPKLDSYPFGPLPALTYIPEKDDVKSADQKKLLPNKSSKTSATKGELIEVDNKSKALSETVAQVKNENTFYLQLRQEIEQAGPSSELYPVMMKMMEGRKEKLSKEEFLYLCFSGLPSWFITNESMSMLLKYILFGGESTKDAEPMLQMVKEKLFPALLGQFITLIGALMSNISGVQNIASQFEGKDLGNSPQLFITNCSLSDIYENKEYKLYFQSILKNLNTTYTEQNRHHPVGFCVIPSVSFDSDFDDDTVEDDHSALFEHGGVHEQVDVKIHDLGDSAKFSHTIEHLKFCADNSLKVMHLVSHSRSLTLLTQKAFEQGSDLKSFTTALKNNLKNSEILSYVSVCIPDSTLLPSLQYSTGEIQHKIPAMPIKGAFLVAAILMRNDQSEILKQLLPREVAYIQTGQPGVNIGPETIWKGARLVDLFPHLFQLPKIHSAIDYDVEVMDKLLKDDAISSNCYSFLVQARSRDILLRTANTLAVDGGGAPIMLSDIRRKAYLEDLKRLFPRIPQADWDKYDQENKRSQKLAALHMAEVDIPFINAVY